MLLNKLNNKKGINYGEFCELGKLEKYEFTALILNAQLGSVLFGVNLKYYYKIQSFLSFRYWV